MSIKIEDISKFYAQNMRKKWEDRTETMGWLEDNFRQMGYGETANEISLIRPFIRDFINDLITIEEGGNE